MWNKYKRKLCGLKQSFHILSLPINKACMCHWIYQIFFVVYMIEDCYCGCSWCMYQHSYEYTVLNFTVEADFCNESSAVTAVLDRCSMCIDTEVLEDCITVFGWGVVWHIQYSIIHTADWYSQRKCTLRHGSISGNISLHQIPSLLFCLVLYSVLHND